MKIKQIKINHPELGEITVNSFVPYELMKEVGTVTGDFSKIKPFYSGDIWSNDDGTFSIRRLRVVETNRVGVGHKETDGGCTGGVTMITNFEVDKESPIITIYPSGVISLIKDE